MQSKVGVFGSHRARLFAVAYRMLGSASEADDVLQEAYLRWTAAADVRDPAAFRVRVVTRLWLNELETARRRREVYVGPWLPEPLLTGGDAAGPAETVEHRESVSLAVLLLERLTPRERAVLVLRASIGATGVYRAGDMVAAPGLLAEVAVTSAVRAGRGAAQAAARGVVLRPRSVPQARAGGQPPRT